MKKARYTLIVDGKEAYSSNSISILKEKAAFEFDYLKAFYAEIKQYNKVYATRFYNSNWR